MKKSIAFFDVDETLISVKSMLSFQKFYYQQTGIDFFMERYVSYQAFYQDFEIASQTRPRAELNKAYYQSFYGREMAIIQRCCWQWFEQQTTELWIEPGVRLLQHYQDAGMEVVLVSGSFIELLAPIAQALNADNIIATQLEVHQGQYSGQIIGPPCIGKGKEDRIKAYCQSRDIDLQDCVAVGDDISDFPMLDLVGKAHVIEGNLELMRIAKFRGWQVHSIACQQSKKLINI
ncbi:MAG: HAD-IB family hydrolase [Pseudomonadales bacterium]|nr:HAD-IB family hydrolase [Pseudomonadales bacterium]